jgi:hypothetical protein
MHRPNYTEWESDISRHDDTRHDDTRHSGPRSDDIAMLFDSEIRRRVGEMIARAAIGSNKFDR